MPSVQTEVPWGSRAVRRLLLSGPMSRDKIVSRLMFLVPSGKAARNFIRWSHAQAKYFESVGRKRLPVTTPTASQIDTGRRELVRRSLSNARSQGYIEIDDDGMVTLTEKGRQGL